MLRNFFNAIKNLFPRGGAFKMLRDTTLRRLVEAMAVLPADIRNEMELVYLDLFPDTTRAINKWEKIFLIVFSENELTEYRRRVLQALWAISGRGQGAHYLEYLLQILYPKIKVIENVPVSNPRSSNVAYIAACGYHTMRAGNTRARCAYRIGSENFEPIVLRNDTGKAYDIPNDKRFWEMCFFVAEDVVRNGSNEILFVQPLKIPIMYKKFIEYLILRYKPVQSTALLEVEWI